MNEASVTPKSPTSKSVLNSVKASCNIEEDDVNFDEEICGHINTALSMLCQLGVIPTSDLQLVDDDELTWDKLIPDTERMAMAIQYVKDKVRLAFDPPANASLLTALKERIAECEWRAYTGSEVV